MTSKPTVLETPGELDARVDQVLVQINEALRTIIAHALVDAAADGSIRTLDRVMAGLSSGVVQC
jgi:hypothetical protein